MSDNKSASLYLKREDNFLDSDTEPCRHSEFRVILVNLFDLEKNILVLSQKIKGKIKIFFSFFVLWSETNCIMKRNRPCLPTTQDKDCLSVFSLKCFKL